MSRFNFLCQIGRYGSAAPFFQPSARTCSDRGPKEHEGSNMVLLKALVPDDELLDGLARAARGRTDRVRRIHLVDVEASEDFPGTVSGVDRQNEASGDFRQLLG